MSQPMHGGALIADHIHRKGITHLFTLCGGHISPILVESANRGIKVVDVRHEASAVFAADAYARMTGRPGVAAVTAGPGVTNTVTAVKNAQMAQSPVVLIGGATPTMLKNRGSLQDIDQQSVMASLVKWQSRASTLAQLDNAIAYALEIATEGVPGPVFIEAPVDLLYPRHLVRQMYAEQAGLDKLQGPAAVALRSGLSLYLKRQESQPAWSPRQQALKLERLVPDWRTDRQIADVAERLAKARQPALIIGSQALAMHDPHSAARLAHAVSDLGIPTWTGGMARGLLGAHHGLLFRHKRSAALKEADLVIVAGFPFDFRLNYGRGFHPKAQIISANLSKHDLYTNRRPTVAIQHHPGEFLEKLAQHGTASDLGEWVARLNEREAAREAEIDALAEGNGDGVNPVGFFRRLDEALEDDDILIVDGGDFAATAAYTLKPRKPLSWLDPGAYGTLGVGGGFALGAGTSGRDGHIWLLWGDGSSAYSLAEFDTFVRHGLAPIAIIGTDASWGQIAREQEGMLGDNIGTYLRETDYHTVAEGYGGVGIKVTETDQIPAALKRARKLADKGQPVCINLLLGKSNFREGSISM